MALYNLMADEGIVHTLTQETLGSYKVVKRGWGGWMSQWRTCVWVIRWSLGLISSV